MFQFEYPYLIVLVFLPLLIFFIFSSSDAGKTGLPTIYNPNIKWLSSAFGSKVASNLSRAHFNYLLFLIWVALVFALMTPQRIEKISKVTTKGYDIVMAIDLSRSMLALDFSKGGDRYSRLDIVKSVGTEFILGRQGDRLGIVAFGDNAYLQTPLTHDNNSVAAMLQYSEVGLAGDSTAIGDAIALSVKTLREKPEGSRVIILLTDGSNTAGQIDPMKAAYLAKEYGIKIYSIGIGKNGRVPFPDRNGRIRMIDMEFDETLLKKISQFTGGNYFQADDKNGLEKIYKKINEMEKTESQTTEIILREQLFYIPLSIAIIIMFLRIILNYKWIRLFSFNKGGNL